MCYEMRGCTQCVSRQHRAQETCKEEYEPSVVDSLLGVLRTLDEERVAVHLKEVNGRMAQGGYDAEANSVSLMFEVLTFPILLDDQFLTNEFQVFIEAVDNAHELSFASKQFPGVYALLFLKRRRALITPLIKSQRSGQLHTLC